MEYTGMISLYISICQINKNVCEFITNRLWLTEYEIDLDYERIKGFCGEVRTI